METTKRFDDAVSKLYKAFHENRLNAGSCSACAVGNICNNQKEWAITGGFYIGESQLWEDARKVLKGKRIILETGYSAYELANVEMIFMTESNYHSNLETKDTTKEEQFNGLCAVVEYLCELDNIPNVMDYTKLFETENEKPKYQLS